MKTLKKVIHKDDAWMFRPGCPLDPFHRKRINNFLIRADSDERTTARLLTTITRLQYHLNKFSKLVINPLMIEARSLGVFYAYPESENEVILRYTIDSYSYWSDVVRPENLDPILADIITSVTYDDAASNFGNIFHRAVNRERELHMNIIRLQNLVDDIVINSTNFLEYDELDKYRERIYLVNIKLLPSHKHREDTITFYVRSTRYKNSLLACTLYDVFEKSQLSTIAPDDGWDNMRAEYYK